VENVGQKRTFTHTHTNQQTQLSDTIFIFLAHLSSQNRKHLCCLQTSSESSIVCGRSLMFPNASSEGTQGSIYQFFQIMQHMNHADSRISPPSGQTLNNRLSVLYWTFVDVLVTVFSTAYTQKLKSKSVVFVQGTFKKLHKCPK